MYVDIKLDFPVSISYLLQAWIPEHPTPIFRIILPVGCQTFIKNYVTSKSL